MTARFYSPGERCQNVGCDGDGWATNEASRIVARCACWSLRVRPAAPPQHTPSLTPDAAAAVVDHFVDAYDELADVLRFDSPTRESVRSAFLARLLAETAHETARDPR